MITDEGIAWMADVRAGVEPDPKILYLAWGTGTTAEAAGDTALENEAGRKAVSAYKVGASAGESIVETFLDTGEANGVDITEWGFFSGSGASLAAGSGRLISRKVFGTPENKNDLETLTVTRSSTITRAP